MKQYDIDTGNDIAMPEYAFYKYLEGTDKLFKYPDECLAVAKRNQKLDVYNLLVYKVNATCT